MFSKEFLRSQLEILLNVDKASKLREHGNFQAMQRFKVRMHI